MCVKQLVVVMLLWRSALCILPRTPDIMTTVRAPITTPTTSDTVFTSSGSISTQVSGEGAYKPKIISKQWSWTALEQKDKKKVAAKFGGGGVSVYKDAKGEKKGVLWHYNGTGLLRPLNDSEISDEFFKEDAMNSESVKALNLSYDSEEEGNEVEVRERRSISNADEEQTGRARRELPPGIQSSASSDGNSHTLLSIVATLLILTILD